MGVNQGHQATRTAQAIINLALMTGNIGKPGTGANSITGQCNAMGSRLFSNTTNLLGGHDFKNPSASREDRAATGIPVERIPDRPSLAYDQIIKAADEGTVKGHLVRCHQPESLVDSIRTRSTAFSTSSISSSCRTCTAPPRPRSARTSCFLPRVG
jgi:anaerobic selenocysteine-containing dehydrogenase